MVCPEVGRRAGRRAEGGQSRAEAGGRRRRDPAAEPYRLERADRPWPGFAAAAYCRCLVRTQTDGTGRGGEGEARAGATTVGRVGGGVRR